MFIYKNLKVYTLLNPHIIDFVAEPIFYKWIKRRPLKKYGYLISESIKKYGHINILVDSGTSGFVPMKIYIQLPFFLRKMLSKIEISIWKKRNAFGKEVCVFYSPEKIQDKKVLVFFNYKHYKNGDALIKSCSYFKHSIGHLSHYHNSTALQSSVLKKISNIRLAADVDISDNIYFKKYFEWYKKNIFILPFAVEDRFVDNTKWETRTDKILSVGTFHYFEEEYLEGRNNGLEEFYETSKAKALHPLRRDIFERKDQFKKEIDCMNSPYLEVSTQKSIWKMLLPSNTFTGQKEYFSFNIVDKFNDHKFVIVGEELITGLPGIGTFEALACGCIVIGDKSAYGNGCYENLIQVENLTIEKAIQISKTISSRPNKNITHFSNALNFVRTEELMNIL